MLHAASQVFHKFCSNRRHKYVTKVKFIRPRNHLISFKSSDYIQVSDPLFSKKLFALAMWHEALFVMLTVSYSTRFLPGKPFAKTPLLFTGNAVVFPCAQAFEQFLVFEGTTFILKIFQNER